MKTCGFCSGEHTEEACPSTFKPIKNCEHADPDDGCCHFPGAMTPECHVHACPRLDTRVSRYFKPPGNGDGEILGFRIRFDPASRADRSSCHVVDQNGNILAVLRLEKPASSPAHHQQPPAINETNS